MPKKYTLHIRTSSWYIYNSASFLLISLLLLNIFSGYINSWLLTFPVPTIGSVLRDVVFLCLIFPLVVVALANKNFKATYPVVMWGIAAAFCLLLVFFAPSVLSGAMGFRNIFYPLAGISVLLFFYRNDNAQFYALKLRSWTVIVFIVISIFGILDFSTGGEFPKLLGFNPAYNDLVSMMVRKHLGITRANAGVSDALNYGYLMAFSALYASYLMDNVQERMHKVAWLLMVASSVACILSMTRGAIIALLMVMFLKMFIKAPVKTLLISSFFLMALMSYASTTEYGRIVLDRFTEKDAGSESSSNERVNMVFKSLSAISENPILGVGLGSQGAPNVAEDIDLRIATDNSFFWILLDTGVFGFCLIMSSYALTFIYLIKKAATRHYKKFVLLSLILLVIAALLSSAPVSPTFALCFWVILASEFFLAVPVAAKMKLSSDGMMRC